MAEDREHNVPAEDAGQVDRLLEEATAQAVAEQFAEAAASLGESLALAVRLEYREGEARSLRHLGEFHLLRNDFTGAKEHFDRAERVCRGSDQFGEQAQALLGAATASLLLAMGDASPTVGAEVQRQIEDAVALFEKVGDRDGEATALLRLGEVRFIRNERKQALADFKQARGICEEIGDRDGEVASLLGSGLVEHVCGRSDSALAILRRACEICEQAGDRTGEAAALVEIGEIHLQQGSRRQAVEDFERALRISRETGEKGIEAIALLALSKLRAAQGRPKIAQVHLMRARAIGTDTSLPLLSPLLKKTVPRRQRIPE